jgi:hypothetical protein
MCFAFRNDSRFTPVLSGSWPISAPIDAHK